MLVKNDGVKIAYLKCHDIIPGRMTIENWNSSDEILFVLDFLTVYWNNSSFAPITKVILDLHSDYSRPEVPSYNKVAELPPAIPEKCEDSSTQ